MKFVRDGMVLGLGTGSTVEYALLKISELIREGSLRNIVGIPTSTATLNEALRLGIGITDFKHHSRIDLTIDGADEIDPGLNLIKGGGGALLHEKIVAQASDEEIIIADDSKFSQSLGTKWALPVEVMEFALYSEIAYLKSIGADVKLRMSGNVPFVTDEGNLIIDCNFGPIPDINGLAGKLDRRAGIVEHGLFIKLATRAILASPCGIKIIESGNGN